MLLINRDPLNLFDRVHQRLNSLAYSNNDGYRNSSYVNSWNHAVDIREEKDKFLIMADIPGVDPKDIEITMEDGVLTVKGERYFKTKNDDETYKRLERSSGSFYRRFSLPDTADGEHIEAKGNNGVLEITIPKHEKVQPRKIEVKS